jgi:hypothetical protein
MDTGSSNTSRKPISRCRASTASCRRWRPQGSGEAGGDLGLGAVVAILLELLGDRRAEQPAAANYQEEGQLAGRGRAAAVE